MTSEHRECLLRVCWWLKGYASAASMRDIATVAQLHDGLLKILEANPPEEEDF